VTVGQAVGQAVGRGRNRFHLLGQPQAVDRRVDRMVGIHVGAGEVYVDHRGPDSPMTKNLLQCNQLAPVAKFAQLIPAVGLLVVSTATVLIVSQSELDSSERLWVASEGSGSLSAERALS